MGKPTPILWVDSKKTFVKMGAGDGGITIPAIEMNSTLGGLYTESLATYENKAIYIYGAGICTAKFEEITAGMYSLVLRCSWWNNSVDATTDYTNDAALFNINIYAINTSNVRTNIATSVVRPSDFAQFNGSKYGSDFGSVGLVFNYKNNSNENENLFIECNIPGSKNYHMRFDYMTLSSILAGIYSLPVIQL